MRLPGQITASSSRTQQHQFHGIEDDTQVLQLIDEWHTPLLQWLVDGGIASRSGEKHDPVPQMGRSGHEGVIKVESVELRHHEVADHYGNSRIVGQSLQRVPSGFRLADGETTPLEDLSEGAPDGALIVYQENGGHSL
jgi:hypothetical protein